MMKFEEIANLIKKEFAELEVNSDESYVVVKEGSWLKVAQFIKENSNLKFDFLSCLTSVDGEEAGFYIAYNFLSMKYKHALEIRVFTNAEMKIPSIVSLWKGADWHEREAYDLMGVKFVGHPDMRRILLPSDWEGHPLQKKYKEPEYYHGMPVPKDKSEWE